MSANREAALKYAAAGRYVFPLHTPRPGGGCSCPRTDCDRIGKHPRTKNGLSDASNDPDVIRTWWGRWPDANPAIVTGRRSQVFVVGPDGAEGLADLETLQEVHGRLPDTLRAKTGSGGEHWYYQWPADDQPIPNRKNHRELKIDIRGEGDGPGYAVAPPGVNENGPYVWLNDLPVAVAPLWLLEWARTAAVKFTVPTVTPRPTVTERAVKYIAKCPGAVAGAGGHSQTFSVARALCWGFLLPKELALGLLLEHYNPRCSPPWSEKELRHKVEQASTKDFGKPRGYLLTDGDRRDQATGGSGTNGSHHTDRQASNFRDFRDGFADVAVWQPPAPLPEMPPVPPFPIEVLPAKVADYWKASADSLAVPVDYVAVPGMTCLGAAIGRTRAAGIKGGYIELPSLYSAVIAPPGSVKSASLKAARKPLTDWERTWSAEHANKILDYDADQARYDECYKDWKKNKCQGEPPRKPVRPVLRQMTLDSTTVEAVVKVLRDNPRGAIVIKDELSGLLCGMNQYRSGGKGDDKQFWLSAWAGAPVKVNRAKDHDAGPIYVNDPFMAITGMMTPSSLPELRGDNRRGETTEDGWVDRFLLSFPDPVDAIGEQWTEVSEDLKAGYAEVYARLLGLEMVEECDGLGRVHHRPYIVKFSEGAREAWETFTNAMATAKNRLDKFDHYRGVLSKLTGYGGRLAILLWCVRRECGELEYQSTIDEDTIHRATQLVDYFEGHARRCLGVGWSDRKHRVAKRILSWLTRHPDKSAFSRSEAFLYLKDRRDVTNGEALTDPLRVLTDHAYVRPLDPTGNGRPGPAPEVYAINPLWPRSCETCP